MRFLHYFEHVYFKKKKHTVLDVETISGSRNQMLDFFQKTKFLPQDGRKDKD